MAKIGEIGLDTPSGVVKLPVYSVGDSGSGVYEIVKVQTPGGTGFIPMVDNSGDAQFPYIKLQTTSHGVLHSHDSSTVVRIIDDFEDNSISEYGGETGGYATVTDSHDGTYALRGSPGGDASAVISSTSGLSNYPSTGDTFEWWSKTPGDASGDGTSVSGGMIWFTNEETSTPNGYVSFVDYSDDEFVLYRLDNGSTVLLGQNNQGYSANTWYRTEVTHTAAGDITATLYDSNGTTQLSQITANDTTYSSGGIGWHTGTEIDAVDMEYDSARIIG